MLEADCSGYALGGCLLQKQIDKSWRPVAYYSRKLSGAEMNYEIHDKELLAIIACMKEWDAELMGLGKIFTILIDHMNLKYFLTRRRLTVRQICWAEFMSRFRYSLVYRKGVENARADALSRRDQDRPKEGDPRLLSRERQALDPIKITKMSLALWNQGVREDVNYVRIVKAIQDGERAWPRDLKVQTEGSGELKPLQAMIAACSFDHEKGILRYQDRIWVPLFEPLTTSLIQNIHDAAVSGHPGRDSTFHQELAIDFMVDLPESDGKTNIMITTDRLLKSVTLESMKKMDAESCAKRFLNCHWRFHGFPKAITSDRGSNWTSQFWKRWCELVGMEQRLSTAYHPQTDGATERANQEVQTYLRVYVAYTQHDWSARLPAAQIAINDRNIGAMRGVSPFFATHGYHIGPIQSNVVDSSVPPSSAKERAEYFVERLRNVTTFMQAAMAAVQERNKEVYNKNRQPAPRYMVGDKVWLLLRNIKLEGQPSKNLGWQHAKYKVAKVISPEVVELNVAGKIHNRSQVDLLLPDYCQTSLQG
ncbi:hypothetical protein K3495_g8004 [Podosphaera aphanis]|nr:hypothetical protein K3495_g8004 [Podosphaera aphanis]